jgi:hypothetical protein
MFIKVIRSVIVSGVMIANAAYANDQTPTLLGRGKIEGDRRDKSDLDGKLEDGSASNQFGGLSALDYTGQGDRFVLLADRGAGDGAVSFPCRFHEADLRVHPETGAIDFELMGTTLLTSSDGEPLVGSLTAHADDLRSPDASAWRALDPEGLRQLSDGQWLVSDEYGPRVVVFNRDGMLTKTFSMPDHFRLRYSEDSRSNIGTFPNRGLEGVAVTPSDETMIAVLQSPLIQDGTIKKDKCLGLNTRWIVFNKNHTAIREIVYPMLDTATGVSEILAVDETKFLVLERDSKAGDEAKTKHIYLCDISGASNVSEQSQLPPDHLPKNISPVTKRLLIDLLDKPFGIVGDSAPEKPEGLSWGKRLPDGRRTLWVCCDNDFESSRASDIFCFAVDEDSL